MSSTTLHFAVSSGSQIRHCCARRAHVEHDIERYSAICCRCHASLRRYGQSQWRDFDGSYHHIKFSGCSTVDCERAVCGECDLNRANVVKACVRVNVIVSISARGPAVAMPVGAEPTNVKTADCQEIASYVFNTSPAASFISRLYGPVPPSHTAGKELRLPYLVSARCVLFGLLSTRSGATAVTMALLDVTGFAQFR